MVQYSIDDLRTPESLERVLRQFQRVLEIDVPSLIPRFPTLQQLALDLAPFMRNQLEATGTAPLNLQSLLPSIGNGTIIQDTHAARLTLYPASNYAPGTLFYETDRNVIYTVSSSSGVLAWIYVAGMFSAAFASRPVDLGVNDTNFLLWVTVHAHVCRWNGTSWNITDGGGGYIVDSPFALPAVGWQVCDGTATDYLVVSGADLAVTAFTTPDEVTAPSGVYHNSIAAYTGVINAASAGAISGSTASAAAGVTVDPHAVVERLDDAGAGVFVFDAEVDADHTVNDPGHTHDAGTLVVAATGQPRNMGVLRYFRR